jgi:tetratricopeptide (TPR) repeat protein
VRSGQSDLGLESLREAADLDRDNPRYAYVFAVALNSLGQGEAAVAYLEDVINDFPGDFDLQWTLATILRDQQRIDEARAVATTLAEIYPGIPPLENFLRSL